MLTSISENLRPSNIIVPSVGVGHGSRERTYDVFSRLVAERVIFVQGEIEDNMASVIVAQLLHLDHESNAPIYMYINSPGGVITAGMSILDAMMFVASPIIQIGMGMCASMGMFLLCAKKTEGPGAALSRRLCLPNTEIMMHQPLGGTRGQASDIEIQANHMARTKARMTKYISSWTGHPEKKIIKDADRDNYMYADEALAYGIIDEIVTHKKVAV
jgi:ATP-dependent Clp protease, protease subunit